MAFDGIVTRALADELAGKLTGGRVDKIYQPEEDHLLLHIAGSGEKYRLFLSSDGNAPRACLSDAEYVNPQTPMPFCMLLRKHIQSSRLREVRQVGSERIIEFLFDSVSELGYSVSHKLVFECMGKHSNILLVNLETGKIVDAIKRVSPDMSRVRPVLPGMIYEYPPSQDKVSLEDALVSPLNGGTVDFSGVDGQSCVSVLCGSVAGVSKAFAEEIAGRAVLMNMPLDDALYDVLSGFRSGFRPFPAVYLDEAGAPKDFHVVPLRHFEDALPPSQILRFETVSSAVEYFYEHKTASNRMRQKSSDLLKQTEALLSKNELKLQKIREELRDAENAEKYRLYGELITANLHVIPSGAEKARVLNYYTNAEIEIPLDPRFSPQKNAQRFFKKYGKAKTAVKEKTVQLAETEETITYLRSVLSFVEQAGSPQEIEQIRQELVDGGYLRKRKDNFKSSKSKLQPLRYETSGGFTILVGRNNIENDQLTLHTAEKRDIWFHSKDVPGSHVILRVDTAPERINAQSEAGEVIEGYDLGIPGADLFEAAAVAAYHSKARDSVNVAIDYCTVRRVKKPAGAKPGMVIFTDNRTLYVNPALPGQGGACEPEKR